MSKLTLKFLGATSLVCSMAQGALAENINIGIPNWTSAAITGEIIRYIAATDLGLEVGTVSSTNPVIFAAMDVGSGDIDVHPEVWMPNQANLAKQYVEDAGTVAFAAQPYGARQGVCTTRYTAETLGIRSVYDLANAELSAKFDTNGDGKGEFWPGALGWNSTNVEMVKAREYGYDQFWELVPTDEALHYTKMENAGDSDGFYLGICQEPHHIFARQDLVWLDEPAYDAEAWKMVQPTDDPEWFSKSSVATAWPVTSVRIAYSKSLEDRSPDFVNLLNNMLMNAELVGSWTSMVAVDGLTPAQAAEKWVNENRATVDGWLGL